MRGGRKWLLAVAGALGLVCLGGQRGDGTLPGKYQSGLPYVSG